MMVQSSCRGLVVSSALVALSFFPILGGCSRARPDVGTLPRVEIPIEKKPEQDPNLFREETPPAPRLSRDLPDPEPLRMSEQVYYDIEFNKGNVRVLSERAVRLKEPQSTPRRTGRFAFELWRGHELVERVRFDFPLLAASTAEDEDALEAGLVSQISVRVPASALAATARILDRKTRKAVMVTWPPPPISEPTESVPKATPRGDEPAPVGADTAGNGTKEACTGDSGHCEPGADGGD